MAPACSMAARQEESAASSRSCHTWYGDAPCARCTASFTWMGYEECHQSVVSLALVSPAGRCSQQARYVLESKQAIFKLLESKQPCAVQLTAGLSNGRTRVDSSCICGPLSSTRMSCARATMLGSSVGRAGGYGTASPAGAAAGGLCSVLSMRISAKSKETACFVAILGAR